MSAIDNTLYDAFGQRQVSVIYSAQNQYHVVMEVAPRYWQDPRTLDNLYVSTAGANPTGSQQTAMRLALFVAAPGRRARQRRSRGNQPATSPPMRWRRAATPAHRPASALILGRDDGPAVRLRQVFPGHTPLSVNHQGLFAAATISFNLAPGRSLSEAQTEIDDAIQRIGMPSSVRGSFAGTAATYSSRNRTCRCYSGRRC